MLFAFVACENDGDKNETPALEVVGGVKGSTVVLSDDIQASLFTTDGVTIASNVVTGKVKNVTTGLTDEYYGTTDEVTTGYFVPVQVKTDVKTGAKAKIVVSGISGLTKTTFEDVDTKKDGYLVIYLGTTAPTAETMKDAKATITVTNSANEKWEAVLTLSGITVEA